MFHSTLRTVLLCLLSSSVCIQAASTQRNYIPVTGDSFIALETAVLNSFGSLLMSDIQRLNDTINSLNPLVSSCLASIESSQTQCIDCINSTCQARVDTLGCTDVTPVSASSGGCDLAKAICDMQAVANKVGAAINVATNAVKHIAEKVAGAIKNVAEEAINTIGSGLQKAGQDIKNVAENVASGVKNTAENVASGVENAAKKVGETIAKGVEDAANAVAKFGKDVVDKTKEFFDNLGRRRRQAGAEPTCDDFSQDTGACLFYESQCQTCSAFDLGGTTEPSVSELITGVCGQADLDNYLNLDAAIQGISNIVDVYNNFTLQAARYDASVFENGGFKFVQFDFTTVINDYVVSASTPINPFITNTAGPVIAQDIYNTLFPTAA